MGCFARMFQRILKKETITVVANNPLTNKGLGNPSPQEMQAFFRYLDAKERAFVDKLKLTAKTNSGDRMKKERQRLETQGIAWLDQNKQLVKNSDFVHKERIIFSLADLQPALPMTKSFKEAKVAQLSDYTSKKSAYNLIQQDGHFRSHNLGIVRLDQNNELIKNYDFVHKERIIFSLADLQPSLSITKSLKDAKVAQLSDDTSEKSAYRLLQQNEHFRTHNLNKKLVKNNGFVHKESILFSLADQRTSLFITKSLKEAKVAQISDYISDKSADHLIHQDGHFRSHNLVSELRSVTRSEMGLSAIRVMRVKRSELLKKKNKCFKLEPRHSAPFPQRDKVDATKVLCVEGANLNYKVKELRENVSLIT